MSSYRKAKAACAVLCSVVVLACNDAARSTAPETEAGSYTLLLVDGDGQIGEAGTPLRKPLQVRVIDAAQLPVARVRIEWKATSGTFDNVSTLTDATGGASVTLTLGLDAGPLQASATIAADSSSRVTFAATSLVFGAMRILAGQGNLQRDTVRATLATPYSVIVRDHNDAPVVGVEVRWQVYLAGGSVSSNLSRTDANGVAQTTHTLGVVAGTESVLAGVPGLIGSPVAFQSAVLPGAMANAIRASGEGQVAFLGTTLSAPYRIALRDAYGNDVRDVSNVTVDWKVVSGFGSLITDGPTAATHTLGLIDSPQSVTATVTSAPGIPPVLFTSRAVSAVIGIAAGYYCYDAPVFTQSEIELMSGRTVAWMWDDYCFGMRHNITFEDDPNAPTSSRTDAAGTHVRTFTGPPRVIRYRCTQHSTDFTHGMVGTITIR